MESILCAAAAVAVVAVAAVAAISATLLLYADTAGGHLKHTVPDQPYQNMLLPHLLLRVLVAAA